MFSVRVKAGGGASRWDGDRDGRPIPARKARWEAWRRISFSRRVVEELSQNAFPNVFPETASRRWRNGTAASA